MVIWSIIITPVSFCKQTKLKSINVHHFWEPKWEKRMRKASANIYWPYSHRAVKTGDFLLRVSPSIVSFKMVAHPLRRQQILYLCHLPCALNWSSALSIVQFLLSFIVSLLSSALRGQVCLLNTASTKKREEEDRQAELNVALQLTAILSVE